MALDRWRFRALRQGYLPEHHQVSALLGYYFNFWVCNPR